MSADRWFLRSSNKGEPFPLWSKISREQVQEWFAAPETVSYYTKRPLTDRLVEFRNGLSLLKYLPKQGLDPGTSSAVVSGQNHLRAASD